jgi:hypothetical protein
VAETVPQTGVESLPDIHESLVSLAEANPGSPDAQNKLKSVFAEVARAIVDASKNSQVITAVQSAVVMLPGKWQAIIGVIGGLVVALSGFVGGRVSVSVPKVEGHTIVQNFGDGATPAPAPVKPPEPVVVKRKIVLYSDDAAKAKVIVDDASIKALPFDVSAYPKTFVAGQAYRFMGHDVLVPYAAVIDATGIVLAAEPYTDAKSIVALVGKVK